MKYAKIETPEDLKTAKFVEIDPQKCPHFIFVGDHYRADGSCKCDNPNETIMASWGYVWSDKTKQWEGGDGDES